MAYSGDPSGSVLDEVRLLTYDTDAENPLLSDDEISYVLNKLKGVYSDPLMVAAFCADRIGAKFAGEVAINADGVSYSGEQLQDKYKAVAQNLRETYAALRGVGAAPYAGGTLPGDHPVGTKPLNFGIGLTDNDRAGKQTYGRRGEWSDDDGNDWP